MSLIKFYGQEDARITGCPCFSFFDRSSHRNNYFRYIEAEQRNQIARYTHFRLENVAYEEKNSTIYNINLSQLLNGYNLLGGIVITIHHDKKIEYNKRFQNIDQILDKIDLILDDVIFTYPLLLLFKSPICTKNNILHQSETMTIINLPVPLFDNEVSWIRLLTRLDVTLQIKLIDVFSIRVDFKVVKLDSEECRHCDIGQILTNEYLHSNEENRSNMIKNSYIDCPIRYDYFKKYECDINNLPVITKVNNVHLGLKTMIWYYIINANILLDPVVSNVNICVTCPTRNLNTKIRQDFHALTISNQIHAMNKITRGAYMYNFSLHPTLTHPSGDLLVNDFDIWIEHEFNDDFLDKFSNELKNKQISIVMITNEFRIMQYYLDLEQNKSKCKFVKISETYNNNHHKQNSESDLEFE